jgi:hypothetical protein
VNLEDLPELTLPALALGHAALSVLILCLCRTSSSTRTIAIRVAAALGTVLAAALAVASHGDLSWRGFSLETGPAVVVAVAGACAWLIVAARAHIDPRVERAALVGAGVTGLGLAASSLWLVPVCLFLLVIGLAALATVTGSRGAAYSRLGVAAGVAGVVAVLGSSWLDGEAWLYPRDLGEPRMWLLVAAAAVLAGCLPSVGAWATGSRGGAETTPLVLGAGFLFLLRPAITEQPWAAAGTLLVGAAGYLWVARKREVTGADIGGFGPWPLFVALGLALTLPSVIPGIASAALLALTVLIISPAARPSWSAFLLAYLPPSVGFVAISLAGAAAFDRAIAVSEPVDALPWSAIVLLLPLVLGSGILATRALIVGHKGGPRDRAAVLAVWLLSVTAIALGFFPHAVGLDPGRSGRELLSLGLALLLGVGAAALAGARHHSVAAAPVDPEYVSSGVAEPVPSSVAVGVLAIVLFALAVVGVGYLLVEGLKVGFL